MRFISSHYLLIALAVGTHTHINTHTHTHTDDLHRINFKKPGVPATGLHAPDLIIGFIH